MTRLTAAFAQTCTTNTYIHWILDSDDPEIANYRQAFHEVNYRFKSLWVIPPGPPGIVHPINYVVNELSEDTFNVIKISMLGFMGDDHLPQVRAWDERFLDINAAMGKLSILYGDDKFQGARLPTAAFISSGIVSKLGFIAPPELRHLYVDDYWRDLGNGAEVLRYVPEVTIEHLHYLNDKAPEDATYERNNNSESATLDRVAYALYKHSGKLQRDISAVKELRMPKPWLE